MSQAREAASSVKKQTRRIFGRLRPVDVPVYLIAINLADVLAPPKFPSSSSLLPCASANVVSSTSRPGALAFGRIKIAIPPIITFSAIVERVGGTGSSAVAGTTAAGTGTDTVPRSRCHEMGVR
jgi:hypothetical protein